MTLRRIAGPLIVVVVLVAASLMASAREDRTYGKAIGARAQAEPPSAAIEPPATTTTTSTTSSTTTTTTTAPLPPPSAGRRPDGAPGGTSDGVLLGRVRDALASAVPSVWLSAVSPRLELIGGVTSRSSTAGWTQISRYHASGPWLRLRAVVTHEWAHHAAFRYGSHAYLGAPPSGWPYHGGVPQEAWGDCVALALTGFDLGRFQCDAASVQFIRDWLAQGPP